MTGVSLPRKAAVPGAVRLRIATDDGLALTDYITEQTKDLHLSLIPTDLAVFRHLHSNLGRDGTGSAPVTLPEPGDYRVIAQFIARDAGGNGDQMRLGKIATVPGSWTPYALDASTMGEDGIVSIEVEGDLAVGPSRRLNIVVRDAQGRPVKLGTYLGSDAHMTGFHLQSGRVVHVHPLGQPDVGDTATRLSFHTAFDKAGEYVCFVQLRVYEFLHTIAVGFTVA